MFPLSHHLQSAPTGLRSLFPQQRGHLPRSVSPEPTSSDMVSLSSATLSQEVPTLSKSSPTASAEEKRGLFNFNWRRSLTIGMAGLTLFGGLVAGVQAGDFGPPVKAPTAIEQTIGFSGDSLQGRLLMEDHVTLASPTATPQPVAQPLPFQVSRPKAVTGDYVKHGTNFSQLLTNAEFTKSDAASATEIQSYFVSKGSFLAKYKENGQPASEIIAAAAKDNSINPWVLLSTLEKENGMVTRQVQPRAHVLKASMGYGYTDGGKKIGKTSFEHQVRAGAELLRTLYDGAQEQTFPRKITVDYGKHKIQVDNAATMALMLYTPHTVDTHLHKVGGGNYLFRAYLERFTKENQGYSQVNLQAAQPAGLVAGGG